MLEEGSKPRPDQSGAVESSRRGRGLIGSPWFATGGALAVAALLGAAILAASAVSRFPLLWPALERNYWLLAAISVLACLGCGKDVQFTAIRGLFLGRISGDLIVAL